MATNLNKLLKKIYTSIPFKNELYHWVKRVYNPSQNIYKHLSFKGWFKVKIMEGHIWMYHYGYELENDLFWKGLNGWESTSLSLWIALSKDSTSILDIGANTGVYALLSRCVNPTGKVYAYEPVDRVYKKLLKNVQKNKFDIQTQKIAVSNYDGEATIYDQFLDHIYSVTVNKNLAAPEVKVIPTTVIAKTLSTIITESRIEQIDLIKIDVETHEAEVLEGMGEYLNLFRPILLLEILTNTVAEKVNGLLKEYEFYRIFESKGLKKIERVACNGEVGYNFLAVPIKKKHVLTKMSIKYL